MAKRKLYGAAKKSHEKKVRREKAHKQARKLAKIRKRVVETKRRVRREVEPPLKRRRVRREEVEFVEYEVTATTKGGTPRHK